jgi:hypothetical protein
MEVVCCSADGCLKKFVVGTKLSDRKVRAVCVAEGYEFALADIS